MIQAELKFTYINNTSGKLETRTEIYDLEYLGSIRCIKGYKIISTSGAGFKNGEVLHNLHQNTIQVAFNGKDIYDSDLSWNAVLVESCHKKFLGYRSYVSGLPGECSTIEFKFI